MARHPEPMDVDCMDSDFDNKENTFHHNVPCTEKGYEELDVSELNMKLRYSMTPASSPMSKSYTACPDNRYLETGDTLNCSNENANLTRSLNSTMTKTDNVIKSLKSLPLQSLHMEQFTDGNGNASVLRQIDSTTEDSNITVTVSESNDIDENLSLPSSSSSALHTPESTTPTKGIKNEASPIMRGLKSVLHMFLPSTSPTPPMEGENITVKQEILSPNDTLISENAKPQAVASTPIAAQRSADGNTSKRSSPYKDSIVFNDDLEKELNWKDEKTSSSSEKMPIHKLLLQNSKTSPECNPAETDLNSSNTENNFHSIVEYMDVSNNGSILQDKTLTECHNHEVSIAVESDSDYVDCETTFSKNESYVLDIKEIQEKISPKPNLDKTQNISFSTKNTEFEDCDSSFSKNESYVLDIKEIQEKIFAKPNLNEIKHISGTAENAHTLNQSIDVTSMSFADLDINIDMTVPSDYSDYSQATVDILSELEKLEANVPSEIYTNKHTVKHENNTEQKDFDEQQVDRPEVVIQNITLDAKINLDQKNESTVSQDNEFNNTNNECDQLHTTLTGEQSVELDNTLTKGQNADIVKSITTNSFEATETVIDTVQCTESLTESENKSPQSQQAHLIQDNKNCTIIETPVHVTIADLKLETTIIKHFNKIENKNDSDMETISQNSTETPEAISNNILDTVPSEMQIVQNAEKSLDILNHIQNDVIPVEVLNSLDKDIVLSEVSRLQHDVIPATSQVPPDDLPLADELVETVKTLDLAQNVTVIQTTEVQKTENPADIPLPDDDFDKEAVLSEVPITSMETAPAFTSYAINSLTGSEVTDTVPKVLVDTLVANETTYDSTFTSEISGFQLSEFQATEISGTRSFELQTSENTDTNTPVIKTLETLSEIQINSNETVLPELNNLSLKTDSDLPLEHPALVTTDLNSTATEIIYEKIPDSLHFTNDINKSTVVTNILVHNQSTSQIEPMDITLNESLNLTHELPDLVNQTIVLAEEIMQIPDIENNTVNEPIQVELAPNPSDVTKIQDLETVENISEIVKCGSDFETNFKIDLVETVSANENSTTPKELIVKNLPINDEKQPASGAENVVVDNEAMKLSDDLPPKVFTNTPESELMEVEGTMLDEEIVVSATNSPYVSLMSGIESVPEKIEDTFEEIENPFIAKTNIASSPPITSKGYNFNFDEVDDPFATKTKMRLSPPLDTPTKPIETENEKDKQFKVPNKRALNRRQSQPPERRKPAALKNKFNTTFDAKSTPKTFTNKMDNTVTIRDVETKITDETSDIIETCNTTHTYEENRNESKDNKEPSTEKDQIELVVANMSENTLQASVEDKLSINSAPSATSSDLKTTSSSEQSTYYSAGDSSTESFQSKNVFNLPEIDDVNFNPFATKSKMRQSPPIDIKINNPFTTRSKMLRSPPPDMVIESPFATRSKMRSSPDVSIISYSHSATNCTVTLDESKLAELAKNIEDEDKMETELMEKDTSANITNTTSSSKDTENQNMTIREVNTEDEDTIEGPFLDAGDDIEKFTDFTADNDDMMKFNELQEAQANQDNMDGEFFIDAEAYEFLLNQNKSNVVVDSGKESLFLKFDPLFAKRISSDGVLAALNKAQKKQSTPTKPTQPSLRIEASPIAGPSTLNVTHEGDNNIFQESNEDANITVTKPMMVVTPALNPAVTPRNKSITPARSNRRSITFTSPAIAVIDRLLSMSAHNSILGHDSSVMNIQSNGEPTEADLALTQLRELLAEKEISVYSLRSESKELKDRLSTMETQVRILEADGQERMKKINELNDRLIEKTRINKSMAAVVEEYERTIASLIADIEQDKKRNAEERIRLINERDEQTAHLSSMEVSFSDLHSKYEKSKQVILTCKANEDIFKKTIQDFQEQVTKMQTNYEMLKQHATAKLNHANQELDKINRAHEAEVLKLNAMIKRNHMLATSLQETLAQKTKANDELTAICDELINKVGSK